ncbi:MAG: TerB family tellurite resistance protein [Myxococcales bacterium]|nr:TerB family tellurite resistance protein [Myxococcales bacterium]
MNLRVAQCLLVAKVIVADGMITPEERTFLNATLARLGLSKEERAQVIELEGMEEAERMAATMEEADKREFVELLLTAASADGKLSSHEVLTVQQISRALGLD